MQGEAKMSANDKARAHRWNGRPHGSGDVTP